MQVLWLIKHDGFADHDVNCTRLDFPELRTVVSKLSGFGI